MGKDVSDGNDPVYRQRQQAELTNEAEQEQKGNPHPQMPAPLRESEHTEADKDRAGDTEHGGVVP